MHSFNEYLLNYLSGPVLGAGDQVVSQTVKNGFVLGPQNPCSCLLPLPHP